MKKNSIELISFISISIICTISVLLSYVSIKSMRTMESLADTIVQRPYVLSNSVWKIKNGISLMRVRMDRLVQYSRPDDIKISGDAIRDIAKEILPAVDLVEKNYLGPRLHIHNLLSHMEELRLRQQEVLALASALNDSEAISKVIQQRLVPLYRELQKDTDSIHDFISQNTQRFLKKAQRTALTSSRITIGVTIAILGIAALFHILLSRKNKDLQYRDQLFEIFSNNVDDVFFIYSFEKERLEYVSPNTRRILGLAADVLRTLPEDLLPYTHPEDQNTLRELFRAEAIRRPVECECRITPPHKHEERWLRVRLYPIREHRSRITHYIATLADLTATKRNQQALKDALLGAQSANTARKDFLSRMSHEIRTPMNAIMGMTAIAAAHLDNVPRLEDCLSKIAGSSKHLLMLINDILDMSAIESGKMRLTQERLDLASLINSIVSVFYPQATAKGVRFDVTLAEVTEEIVLGDPLRLNQILINLLSNAIKFTPGGESVTLEVRQIYKKNNRVRLRFTISDTGIGMEESALSHIFLPFEQADTQIVQKYGGTGLGLAIVHNLVALHDGTMDVHSTPGKGSVFSVELPLELPQTTEQTAPPALKDLNVLVVDDDADSCEHATLILHRMGVRATWATTGAEAVEKVVQAHGGPQEFDVCFIDWQMPGIDGIETTRRIRRHVGPEVLIIIISAYDWTIVEKEARAAGVSGFISKPLFQSTLYNTLLSFSGARPPVRNTPADTFDFKGKRVLLAEDNALNMEVAVEILKNTGVEVESVENGKLALERFEASVSGYYDLILLDVQMPEMGGYEAARAIRASGHPDAKIMPIIAMTANAFSEDVAAALNSGMNAHISKPIDVAALYNTLQQYFHTA